MAEIVNGKVIHWNKAFYYKVNEEVEGWHIEDEDFKFWTPTHWTNIPPVLDHCEVCHGESGGVLGNEQLINGVIMCDYCSAKNN